MPIIYPAGTKTIRLGGTGRGPLIQRPTAAAPSGLAFVNATSATDQSGGTSPLAAPAISVAAGNLLVVAAREYGLSGTAAVSDSAGNTYTKISDVNDGSRMLYLFYAKNTIANAATVVTFNPGGGAYPSVAVAQYSGASTTAPYDVNAKAANAAGNSVTSSAFTTTAANEILVLAGSGTPTGGTNTVPSGFTVRAEDSSKLIVLADQIVSTVQTAATETFSNSTATAVLIEVGTFK